MTAWIQTALEDYTDTLTSDSVVHQNVAFKPVNTTSTYWRTAYTEIESRERSMGTTFQEQREGLFQITVFSKVGAGTITAKVSMDLITDGFISGDNITVDDGYVKIERCWKDPYNIEGTWMMEPYTVRWTAWINRTNNS